MRALFVFPLLAACQPVQDEGDQLALGDADSEQSLGIQQTPAETCGDNQSEEMVRSLLTNTYNDLVVENRQQGGVAEQTTVEAMGASLGMLQFNGTVLDDYNATTGRVTCKSTLSLPNDYEARKQPRLTFNFQNSVDGETTNVGIDDPDEINRVILYVSQQNGFD